MANPRLGMGYEGIRDYTPVQFDSSINVPTLGIAGLSVSSSLGLVVTDVSSSSYSVPQQSSSVYNVIAGLGSSGSRILGVVERVEPDGTGTVKTKGKTLVFVNASSPPTVFNTVACDGAGFVKAGNSSTDNVLCVGFTLNSNLAIQQHQQGTITPPTNPSNGPLMAIIDLG